MQTMSQDEAIDVDKETIDEISGGLIKHIFGNGEQDILARLKQGAKDMPQVIGTLAFTLTEEGGKQAGDAEREVDLDMMMAVSTEIVDALMEMSEAAGLIKSADDQALREDSMLVAMNAYSLTIDEDDIEGQEAAQQMLQQFSDDGTLEEGEAEVARLGAARGIDPFADDEAPVAGGPAIDPAQGALQPEAQAAPQRPLIGA